MLGSANIKKDRPKRNGTLQSIRLPARYPLRGHAHLTVQQSFLVGGRKIVEKSLENFMYVFNTLYSDYDDGTNKKAFLSPFSRSYLFLTRLRLNFLNLWSN